MLYAFVNTRQSPKTATVSKAPNVGNLLEKTQRISHNSIGWEQIFPNVIFKVGFTIRFTRKSLSNKKYRFSWGMVRHFFEKRDLKT